MRVEAEQLHQFTVRLLGDLGVPVADAGVVADCLVEAELEGQVSHGITRLPHYARRVRDGLIVSAPEMRVARETAATALLDAGNALGPVAGLLAMRIAVEKARLQGVGVCAVRGSNHLGALSFYVRIAADAGMIGIALCNTPPAMAPPGGRAAFLGTNPIAAGVPTSTFPVVVDMATSQVARGAVLKARREGTAIPLGWAVDREGRATTDPEAALSGSLAPLGGAKGFALALLVEVLAAVLSDAAVGPEVTGTFADSDRPSNVGHLFLALDPEAFGPGFTQRMDGLAGALRGIEPVDAGHPVRLPGDRRVQERERRRLVGLEIPDALIGELRVLAGERGVAALG
ncbi:MAG: lactate dehydrogenase [Candidatus Nephthysia bennettiae]|nr:MAG: lactate dehydrogenase [Candidatus Dormibacteraeota bacterium]